MDFLHSVADILVRYREGLAGGLLVTLKLCAVVWSCGLALGSLLGVAAARLPKSVGWPVRGASFVLGGMPLLVFLFWLHYPLQSLLDVVIDPFYTAAFALSVVNVFLVSDIVRHAVTDFPRQYVIAGEVCGMDRRAILRRIEAPLVLRQILPGLLAAQVTMLQCTLFASLISVEEIFRVAQRINSTIYRPVEIYTALGVLFLAVCLPLNGLALWLKHRFTRDLSEQ
ncbi:amino acid ABC transporter membrane protein 2, PAAT family [Verrucomicrobium sp. GAS474]|uniref:ABC transporter permease subunit n=1 Tax=Verrucomicrobium sp. GAS474 TaxID=1882831 RepID=UPI0008798A5F|nr:ABC transporter permease subunit [Verrucomicrobium sp. GAS474]SDU02491.1 amino acid ABC transporter membrane protein 2, PAAT family [Verrucomicrobium sp. GAS474]